MLRKVFTFAIVFVLLAAFDSCNKADTTETTAAVTDVEIQTEAVTEATTTQAVETTAEIRTTEVQTTEVITTEATTVPVTEAPATAAPVDDTASIRKKL